MNTTTVGTTATVIASINAGRSSRIAFQLANDAEGAALNSFVIQGRVEESAPWLTLSSGDTTTAGFSGIVSDVNLSTLAAGSGGVVFIDGGRFEQVRLTATVASGTTDLTVYSWGS